jgi:hypothetical protein
MSTERRVWVHKCLRNRKTEGEFWASSKELTDDEKKFYQYFRMCRYQFYNLLKKVQVDLFKKNTTFREAFSPQEKVVVCFR